MKLCAEKLDDYLVQFNEFLDTTSAKDKKGIVYIWKTENPFYRVKGKSSIIYIGYTSNTFRSRYKNSRSIGIEKKYFERYYKHMMEMHGPISIDIKECSNPKRSEWETLMEYNMRHKEYPPLNRSIPNEPLR